MARSIHAKFGGNQSMVLPTKVHTDLFTGIFIFKIEDRKLDLHLNIKTATFQLKNKIQI